VLRKWLSRKSAPTSIAESIAAFVRDKGLFRLNSRHIEESGSFPLLIDCLLNQRELSPEDCAAFEDCLFFFDITGSWSSIAELCKKMQGQFGVPMIDIFTALCPLGQHEHLTLFELSPRERSNLAKIAFVKESDFTVVLSNPAILPSLITDRKKFVLTNPAIVARLCNLHLRAFGRNPDIQKVLVCAKIQLFLGKPSCDVIADDVLSGEPENAIRRIVKRFSLQTAISVCQSVQPIDCRAFVSENLPERIEYIRLIQDPIILEELVVDVLSRMEIRQSSHRKKWSTILARVRPFVTHGQKSGLMHHLASELLSCSFDEPFDLRALRNIPLLADRYGLFGVHAVLRDLGVGSVPQICPHFTVIPSDEVGDLRPLGRAPTIADLNLDMGSILHDFAARDKSIVPVFVISHASKQTKVFKNAPKVPISRNVVFLNVVDRDPDELFTQAIALDCVRDLCDAYVNEDATHIIFSFFCKAVSRFLWHLSGVIAHWMEGRRHLLFERFPDDNDRYKFIRRLVKLFKSAPTLERRGIPRAVILPSEYILTGTVEDLRTVRMLHRIQQATDVSIFEPQSFSILMRQGKFELAFRIARARRVDITSTFFQYASREPDLCQVILKIIPYLTDSQLETVIQSVAPILEMTTSKEGIDEFMKQLISTISDESRVFHILMWFERMEEALFYAVFRKLRPCVTELWEKIRFRTDNALVSPCRRLLRLYRIPFEDTGVT
jgi:hypothetical protein